MSTNLLDHRFFFLFTKDMETARQQASDAFLQAMGTLARSLAPDYQIDPAQLTYERPPRADLGDLAFPLFPYARPLRQAPAKLAQQAAALLGLQYRCQAVGPYLNVFFNRRLVCLRILQRIAEQDQHYGHSAQFSSEKIMIEFSSPNTNKPLHLGHLRNNTLGESVARLLSSAGARVYRVNLINDRGVHICKSMLAYQRFAEGETPQSSGMKSDHLVGKYYVRFSQWQEVEPLAEQWAQDMLRQWEHGEPQVRQLWQQMNQWAIEGIMNTYQRTGLHFDQIYRESETYRLGKDIVEQGLGRGVFQRREDGAVVCDLSDEGLDEKVVQRSDGTAIYITQDLGTAVERHHDFPFERLIYVVGSEQNYHFKVLFSILQRLGYSWANRLHHLSYGMVNLPEGKMKSRQGTVVDADDLLDQLEQLAHQEIVSRARQEQLADSECTARAIALGALHYYLLRFNASRDILFNPAESLSFTGNTGPYLQYVCSRIGSLLRKARWTQHHSLPSESDPWELEEQEWELLKLLDAYPAALAEAAAQLNPALLASHLYELAKAFSRLYHDLPILQAEDTKRQQRLHLCQATATVLQLGMHHLLVPFVSEM